MMCVFRVHKNELKDNQFDKILLLQENYKRKNQQSIRNNHESGTGPACLKRCVLKAGQFCFNFWSVNLPSWLEPCVSFRLSRQGM